MADEPIAKVCSHASAQISNALSVVCSFADRNRGSRTDLEKIFAKTQGLSRIISIIAEDADAVPGLLHDETEAVVTLGGDVLDDLTQCLQEAQSTWMPKDERAARWSTVRTTALDHGARLKDVVSVLNLVTEVATFASNANKDVSNMRGRGRSRRSYRRISDPEAVSNMIGADICRLKSKIRDHFAVESSVQLNNYLDALDDVLYTAHHPPSSEMLRKVSTSSSATATPSEGNTEDSGVDMTYETPPSLCQEEFETTKQRNLSLILEDLDDALSDVACADLPPIIPPKSIKRSKSMATAAPAPLRPARPAAANVAIADIPEAWLDEATPAEAEDDPWRLPSLDELEKNPAVMGWPDLTREQVRNRQGGFDTVQWYVSTMKKGPTSSRPANKLSHRLTNSVGSIFHSGHARSSSQPAPTAIFGVSLTKSMAVASAFLTRRTADPRQPPSMPRQYPLCILKCIVFIRQSNGHFAQDIFANQGDLRRVTQLNSIFSNLPTYGSDFDWSTDLDPRIGEMTAYDAAEFIVLYLQRLPTPLITKAVAKRWVAMMTNTSSIMCLDEQALSSCMEKPARRLLKLLLELWRDVADAAHVNGMDSERLAKKLVFPLMHIGAGKGSKEYVDALAFLIQPNMKRVGGKPVVIRRLPAQI